MTQEPETVLARELKEMIGLAGAEVECWGVVDQEYLRRFTQALMDPDPRYWDEEFARSTRYGQVIAPPTLVSHMAARSPPGHGDSLDGSSGGGNQQARPAGTREKGQLPPLPTQLSRIVEAGGELEVYKYPAIGDAVYFQRKYADIVVGMGRDGSPTLTVTIETAYRNQRGELLCVSRSSLIRR